MLLTVFTLYSAPICALTLYAIEGMLAAIGLTLIIKHIPHATGYDTSYEGDESYMRETAESSFLELFDAFHGITPGAVMISAVALLPLVIWEMPWFKKQALLKLIPGPLVAAACPSLPSLCGVRPTSMRAAKPACPVLFMACVCC